MLYPNLTRSIKHLLPESILAFLRKARTQYYLREQTTEYNRTIRRIKKEKHPIKVLFFALDSNTWKYDSLFVALQKDPSFFPTVIVVPQVNKGREFMLFQLEHGYEYYKSKGYPVLCSYNSTEDSYLDVGSLHPDIIFFCNPYDGLVDDRYNIRHYSKNILTCYVNYGFCSVPDQWSCASRFHQSVWRYYVECEANLKQVQKYYWGRNCLVSGYPTTDLFLSTKATNKDWKVKDSHLKKVIWAPHHTIEGQTKLIQFSTFLLFYDLFLKIAVDYKDTVQFVFKPHPLLKPALYNHPDWGKERTDRYYDIWANGVNTSFVNGDYIDLFNSSDAMIHDCGSFIVEYLHTQRPVMYLGNFDRISQSNEVGQAAYACHYEGKTEDDIRVFIDRVVIGGEDPLKPKREVFYRTLLLPPNGTSVSDTIITDLKKHLS